MDYEDYTPTCLYCPAEATELEEREDEDGNLERIFCCRSHMEARRRIRRAELNARYPASTPITNWPGQPTLRWPGVLN